MTIQTLLVGIDFSPESAVAQQHAFRIAAQTDADVQLLHVLFRPVIPASLSALPKLAEAGQDLEDAQVADAQARLETLTRAPAAKDLSITSSIGHGQAEEVLVDTAAQIDADLLILGTHGRTGFRRLRLGSVAESVAQDAPCSVLVARESPKSAAGYEHIVVPTDFSESAQRALELATDLVAPNGSIRIVHYWINPFEAQALYAGSEQAAEYHEFIEASVRERGAVLAEAMRERFPAIVFEHDQSHATEGILHAIEARPTDLVVMGASRHRLGGVARATVRHAPCSVLVVR